MLILQTEKLSKRYKMGEIGGLTLKKEFARWWERLRGRPDPMALIKENKDADEEENAEYIWALKDITFSIQKGETLGIIGKNGAGKSTLLKIISQVVKPTEGKVYLNGSVGSLLEVGTGFDPLLTGKENIYLSGAILGMRRHEINRYYKDIVAFSGVKRFIETPVLRYSSGMYLRLAFAVAAHLQSDLLILDEVLAVGDYEFRKKALTHIKEIAKSNRTIIYVAHQMDSVAEVCNTGLLLEKGRIQSQGPIHKVIEDYTTQGSTHEAITNCNPSLAVKKGQGYLQRITVLNARDEPCKEPYMDERWRIQIDFQLNEATEGCYVLLRIMSLGGLLVNATASKAQALTQGMYSALFISDLFHLGMGVYQLHVRLCTRSVVLDSLNETAFLNLGHPKETEDLQPEAPQALVSSPLKTDLLKVQDIP